MIRRLAAAVAGAAALAACGSAHPSHTTPMHPAPVARLAGAPRIAVIVMENEEYGDIIGAPSTPFINALARRSALASRMYAITHPSLPNYLALTSGSTHGIDSDCTDCAVGGAGLAGQLQRRGISWRAYMEDLPRPCFTGASAGDYAKKHDPFVYYAGITSDPGACGRVVPLSALPADERNGHLARFVWITPNLCHDMHDCAPSVGDHFLARLVPPLLHALGPHGLLILTWDEGASDDGCCRLAQGGHIAAILAGPDARSGAALHVPTDHYSELQLVEDLFGLPRLGGAACACTPSLAGLLRRASHAAGQ